MIEPVVEEKLIVEDIAVEQKVVLNEEFVPPVLNMEVPVPSSRVANSITPARISLAIQGTFLAIAVIVAIFETVTYFEQEAEKDKAQQQLNDAEDAFEQKFQALLNTLGEQNNYKRTYRRNHYQGFFKNGFSIAEPPQIEIKSLWRYGELGLTYLQFRIDEPNQYPSVMDGLLEIEAQWILIGSPYVQIQPYVLCRELANVYTNWVDFMKAYVDYVAAKKKRNWDEFLNRYQHLVKEHGNNIDVQVRVFENSPPIFWSNQLNIEPLGQNISEFAIPIARNVERLVPLLTSFLKFEDTLSDHTVEHK